MSDPDETHGSYEDAEDYTGLDEPCPCCGSICCDNEELEEDQEPPEPDGEAFRGGEAAAYEREQQDWIQRNLK